MGTKNSGRQNEDALKTAALQQKADADASIVKAEAPDAMEEQRRRYVKRVLDWQENPTSVRDFPDGSAMALYRNAKEATDAGRVGKGYGTLSDGGSGTYAAALDKELGMERDLAAAGSLEENVNNAITGAQVEAGHWADVGNARSMNIAGMRNSNSNAAQDRYVNYLSRPQPTSFLKQLALGGLSTLKFSPIKL